MQVNMRNKQDQKDDMALWRLCLNMTWYYQMLKFSSENRHLLKYFIVNFPKFKTLGENNK